MYWLKSVRGVGCPELGGVFFLKVQNVQYLWGSQSGACVLSAIV